MAAKYDYLLKKLRLKDGNGSTSTAEALPMATTERTAITPEAGQLIFDTDLDALYVGDGETAGGVEVGSGGGSVIKPVVIVTGGTVALQPGNAYRIDATNSSVYLSADPPDEDYWGSDGHARIYVGAVGNVNYDSTKIKFIDTLAPYSINDMTLRFHDGMCFVFSEDVEASDVYVVVSATGNTNGTLSYGISESSEDTIVFDTSLNGSTISLGGSTANAGKTIAGNGFEETTLTGTVDCGTSKFTVENLALSDVHVVGGVMTLGRSSYIPSGSTVAISGGGLAFEGVTGAGSGSIIDFGGTNIVPPADAEWSVSSCTITGGIASNGGAFSMPNPASLLFSGVVFSGNSGSNLGGVFQADGGTFTCIDCEFTSNYCPPYGTQRTDAFALQGSASLVASNCTFGVGQFGRLYNSTSLELAGSTTLLASFNGGAQGTITIHDGAFVDMTGNTNTKVLEPGGGILIGSNVQFYPTTGSAGAFTVSKGFPCMNMTKAGLIAMMYPSAFVSRVKPNIFRKTDGTFYTQATPASFKLDDSGGTSVVWVATNGNDANDGTEQSPLATVEAALTKNKVTIFVAAGTYYCTANANVGGHNIIAVGGNVTFVTPTGTTYFKSLKDNSYFEGITFDANGSAGYGLSVLLDSNERCCCYKCTFTGSTQNGFAAKGGNVYLFECTAYGNEADGFSYSYYTETEDFTNALEVDCVSYNNGGGVGSSDNGSTAHYGCRVVRLNGTYYGCNGGEVADKGSEASIVQSVNINCYAHDSTGVGSFSACFWASTYAQMWLYCCRVAGSEFELAAIANSTITSYALDTDRAEPDDYNDGTAIIIRN